MAAAAPAVPSFAGSTQSQSERERERLDQDNYLDPSSSVVRANSNKETVEQLHTHLLAAAEDLRAAARARRASADAAQELMVGTAAAHKRKRRRKVKKDEVQSIGRPFAKVLEDSGLHETASRTAAAPNWVSCTAGPPRRPRRWFCAMCGAQGIYQCPVCKTRFCSKKCNDAHKDVRCLKSVR